MLFFKYIIDNYVMIAMVSRINENKTNENYKFRGKFKNQSFCKWLRFNRKKYVIESINDDNDSDSDNSNDYDKGELINGNKPVVLKYRRPGLFKLFKT